MQKNRLPQLYPPLILSPMVTGYFREIMVPNFCWNFKKPSIRFLPSEFLPEEVVVGKGPIALEYAARVGYAINAGGTKANRHEIDNIQKQVLRPDTVRILRCCLNKGPAIVATRPLQTTDDKCQLVLQMSKRYHDEKDLSSALVSQSQY